MRYNLDFGQSNGNLTPPAFTWFRDAVTHANITAPTIYADTAPAWTYYFDFSFPVASSPSTSSIEFGVSLGGVNLTDVLNSDGVQLAPAVPAATTTSTVAFATAGSIISRAALQLGLGSIADPYGSQDANFLSLVEFLNVTGDDLVLEHDWSQLRKEFTFTTVANQTLYALPDDYHEMLDQTGWNRSTRLPLAGPLSSQQWQYLKARQVGIVFNVLYRLGQQQIELFSTTTPVGATCALEYISSYWTLDASLVGSQTTGSKRLPTQSTDLVLYDPLLVIRGLKLKWLEARGFDTTVALADYEKTLTHVTGIDKGSAVLSLHKRAMTGDRLLDLANIPITNFGGAT